jgi:hypothetical protein
MPEIIYILLGVIIMNMLIGLIFNFLGIEFATYGNYLLWIMALAIFYAVLPSSGDSLF